MDFGKRESPSIAGFGFRLWRPQPQVEICLLLFGAYVFASKVYISAHLSEQNLHITILILASFSGDISMEGIVISTE
jgi:hypothetical protein